MKTNKMKITTMVLVILGLSGFAACTKKEKMREYWPELALPGRTNGASDAIPQSRWGCSRGERDLPLSINKQKILYYTCSMHPQVHQDHPGTCPICGMTLIPVYEETGGKTGGAASGAPTGFIISPERQQLIGIKTTPVMRKPAIKEIRTTGRVAFDPDLAIAQREFLEIVKNAPSLKDSATSRLRLMGMSEGEIRSLEKKGQINSNLYLPDASDTLWIYATLYQDEMNLVSPGQEASISLPSHPEVSYKGIVRSVDPIVDPMTRTVRARIETRAQGLKPNTYVDVTLKQNLGESLLIPKSALIDTGTRKIAFVVHDQKYFESREIKTGPEAGEEIVILDGLKEGEDVVSTATFLVDSESSLKAAISGQPSAPSCPEEQEWDVGMKMCMPKAGK